MTDREKVMWSLARCSCGVPDACSDCCYDNWPPRICVQHLTNDALTMLKAQVPRVMTLEEVLATDKPFFIEKPSNEDGDKEWSGWGVVDTEDREAGTIMFAVIGKSQRLLCNVETMGEYFRCWTTRPTEEQRKAVKWSD